jgi:cytosine/adenosine deaminase-related metal-dependent hydrolase
VTAIGEISTGLGGILPTGSRERPPGPRLRVFREALGLSAAAAAAALRGLAADLPRLARGGIPAGISPHAPYTVARGLGARLIDAALMHRLPVAMHLAESREEAELLARGAGPLRELLESLGAWPAGGPDLMPVADWISRLARGPRGIVVHGTFLTDDAAAMARLVRHRDRLVVAVCPRTTLSLSGRLPPVRAFLDAGVRVAIGTDSRASNPDLDLRGECRAVVAAGLVSPAEVLWMATHAGSFALGFERRCGRLAPGFAADIAVLVPGPPVSDPFDAALAADTRVIATLRGGRLIAGQASIRLPSGF